MNFMSYSMVEMMTFQGLGDLINAFRVKRLGLEPVSSLWAPGALYRMKVPFTYMWSPSLVSKPKLAQRVEMPCRASSSHECFHKPES